MVKASNREGLIERGREIELRNVHTHTRVQNDSNDSPKEQQANKQTTSKTLVEPTGIERRKTEDK